MNHTCNRHGWADDECACPLCFEELPELTAAEQRELALYFRAEFRRVRRPERMQATAPIVYKPKAMVVKVVAAPQQQMSLPACLCAGDTQASVDRRSATVGNYEFWQRKPGNFYLRTAGDFTPGRERLARNDFRIGA